MWRLQFSGSFKKQFHETWIQRGAGLVAEMPARIGKRHDRMPVRRCRMVEGLRDGDDSGEQRDLIPGAPGRMAGAVIPVMMMGDDE